MPTMCWMCCEGCVVFHQVLQRCLLVETTTFFRGGGLFSALLGTTGVGVERWWSPLDVMAGPEELRLLSHQPSGHVCRFLLVCVRVLHHPVLADEPLATHVTSEGLLARVQAHVSPQVRLVVELFGTDLALVRLVSGVLRHVLLKHMWVRIELKVYGNDEISQLSSYEKEY